VLPRANTQAMNLHLAEIAAAVAPEAHAVLVLDGAGWHRGDDLVVFRLTQESGKGFPLAHGHASLAHAHRSILHRFHR
jgi:hypothetical protein